MPVQRVWLVRHGQTDWNNERRWQGHHPTSLNAVGLAQAQALGRHLREVPFGAVYSSDTPRAFETAEAIAAYHELDIQADERLRELNVGVFQGLTPDEIDERYAEEIALWRAADPDYAPPNGETRRELQARMFAIFQEIVESDDNENIAIVSHGGSIRMMLQQICATDLRVEGKLPVPNASYTVVERNGSGWQVADLTVVDHLEQLEGGNTAESAL